MGTDLSDIYRRLASLENERKAPRNEATYSKLKCADAVTDGDVYVLTTTAQLIEAIEDEGSESKIVVAAESKTDSVGDGSVWARCITSGEAWVNFETGLEPTIGNYVITSTTSGKAKTVSKLETGVFGRLVRWDAANNRGLVLMASGGGGSDSSLVYTEQNINPTPTIGSFNVNRQPVAGHFWVYNPSTSTWVRMLGFM